MLVLHAPNHFPVGGQMLPNSESNRLKETNSKSIWLAVVPWLAIGPQIIPDFSSVCEA